MRLAISLPLRNQPELTGLLRQLYSPSSPSYRKFLNPAQFAERFGPSKEDYQTVIAFARAHGLAVTGTHSNRMILDVEAAVSDIEKTFHVKMQVYRHPTEARQFYAPDGDPSVELPVKIMRVSGLDDYALPHPNLQVKAAALKGNTARNAGSGPGGTYSGYDFRAAYVPGTSLSGFGQTVGLLEFDGYTTDDITYYETQANLPNVPLTNVLLDGFTGAPTGSGGEVEVSLDIEVAIAMAPGLSNLMVYEAGPSGNWHDILNRMATDDLASQMSCSWYIPGGTADPVADQIFQQMAAQGQSFFTAEGDYCAYTGLIPFPCDSPYLTTVGGTTLTTGGPGGQWVSETVWNWGNGVGGAGGISTQYSIPFWQQPVNMSLNQGSTSMRNNPDVAMTADNVYVRADGKDQDVGGTSCAAPLWAGFIALVNQQAMTKGQQAGFINPAIYAIGLGASYNSDFNDTVTGNNFSASSPTQFSATPGYDLCTGWGTPAGTPLINALAGPPDSLEVSFFYFNASGPAGGPFLPNAAAYILANTGSNSISWNAGSAPAWITLSATSGTLAVGGSTTVIASLNTHANGLRAADYSSTITFGDATTGVNQTRPVSLDIPPQLPILNVTPTTGFSVGGPPGGPLNPSAVTYLIANAGEVPMSWAVSNTAPWLTVSPVGGNLAAGGTASVTATLTPAAYALGTGTYSGTIAFANLNNGMGNVSVPATLLVWPPPPVITSATTATTNQGQAFTYQIAATNSPTSYQAIGLPAGLSVNTLTGLISGSASATGTTTATISASNAGGTGHASLAITVVPEAPVITGALSVTGTYMAAFHYKITAINGPASFGATGLPDGLVLSSSTGVISGSATSTGTTTATISASNAAGTGTAALVITIVPMPIPVISSPAATLVNFNYFGNGAYPAGSLVQGTDGNLYGTSEYGGDEFDGSNFDGTVFKMTLSGSLTTLVSFNGSNGDDLVAGVIQATDGNFYGTAEGGGAAGNGTVFQVTSSGSLTVLSSFLSTSGQSPQAPLTQGRDGYLYGTTYDGGSNGDGAVFKISLSGSLGIISSFTGSNGDNPAAGFVQGTGTDNNLYGTTRYGGSNGDGTGFKVTTSGSLTPLVSFNYTNGYSPQAGLVTGTDGNFYGTTEYGGSSGDGTVFKMTTSGSLTTLCTFTGSNGEYPEAGLVQGSDGNFYGTTYRGGAYGDGIVFMMTSSGSLTTLYTFNGGNGANPVAGLVQASDGNFYGTALYGGADGVGTIFRVTPFSLGATVGTPFSYQITASNSPTSYSATNLPAGLSVNASTGLISGTPTAAGTKIVTISAVNAGGSVSTALTIKVVLPAIPVITSALNVAPPQGQLFAYQIEASNLPTGYQETGTLPAGLSFSGSAGLISGIPTVAGTTGVTIGAINASGTGSATLTITVTPSAPVITTAVRTLYSFNGTNGSNPAAGVVQGSNGAYFGTTQSDSAAGNGTVFQITPGGSLTTLGFLNWSANGAYPDGALLQASDGNFYGTGQSGGSLGEGAIFRLTVSGSLGSLCSFGYTNGAEPLGGLIQGSDGNLYGTTEGGGSSGQGTVYKATASGSLTTLCSFTGSNGAEPMAGVVQAIDGNLYGTTLYGGSSNLGTLFKVTTSGSLATLCSFTGSNGAEPISGLMQAGNGNLYGTTLYGGADNAGTVFAVTTSGSFTTLCSFNNAGGANPFGVLVQGNDGNFYGTTSSGGISDLGTIFQITPGGSLSTLYSFSGAADGSNPRAGLAQGNDGNLYGTTFSGGANGDGTVFAITPLYVTGSTGAAFTYQITASNNPTSYNATPLPAGLTLNTATGLISGTPLTSGSSNVTISASNAGGAGSATLVITVLPLPVITSSLSATGTFGDAFTYQIAATNSPASYGATGLPAGLGVNAGTGLISGTATSPGASSVTIGASNAVGTGSATLTIIMQTSYAAWQTFWFSPAQLAIAAVSSDTATPAGDGIPNLLKYALNLNPMANGVTGLPVGSVMAIGGSNYLTLSYTQVISATDIAYIPEVSGDLRTWNSGSGYVAPVSVTPNPGGVTETVLVQDLTPTGNGAPRFIRLRVTGP